MNNLLLYCGLVDARIRASEKNLPVHKSFNKSNKSQFKKEKIVFHKSTFDF